MNKAMRVLAPALMCLVLFLEVPQLASARLNPEAVAIEIIFLSGLVFLSWIGWTLVDIRNLLLDADQRRVAVELKRS